MLAGRFEASVGEGAERLPLFGYLADVAGDASSGFLAGSHPDRRSCGASAGGGSDLRRRFFAGCVVLVPVLLLAPARFSHSASPETRHLVFMLPFFSTALATGLVSLFRKRVALASALVLLFAAEIGWAWHRTPALFEGESATRIETRHEASAWLADDRPAG